MSGENREPGFIRIRGMRFWGKHGANPGEREHDQPIDMDVEISADLEDAAQSDALTETIDYSAVYRTCERIAAQRSFALLEALADDVARAVCENPKVLEAVVRVRKPRLLDGATPEVEVRRRPKR